MQVQSLYVVIISGRWSAVTSELWLLGNMSAWTMD